MQEKIRQVLHSSISVKQQILQNSLFLDTIQEVVEVSIQAFRADKKLLFCGNGGSAADAQHLAAEFSGRFYLDRAPLFAEALHVNSSYLTSVANDYGYAEVFSRMVRAKGRRGDVLFGLSTSGNSENIIQAFQEAQKLGVITIGMTGADGGQLRDWSDILLNIPSTDTPRIQEAHITVGHIICELTEAALF
ncbi:MAG TPA: SIS domain-containing protein [Saprospiraceae bacterium]|nr:SIS domain-containing protein [Saprospiraceae bacterium]